MASEYMSKIWTKIVSFDDAQTVLRMQQENIELAHEQHLDPRHIATLERNHDRYQHALKLRKDGDSYPTPWDPRLSEEQHNEIPDLGEWKYAPQYQAQHPEGSPQSPFDWDPPKIAYFYNDAIAVPPCTRCHRVLKILQARNIDLNAAYDARVHWSWTMARSNCLPRRLKMRVAGPWVTYTQFHFDVASRVFKQDGTIDPPDYVRPPEGKSTEDPVSMNVLCRSLEACMREHTRCRSRQERWIPSRLLDVRHMEETGASDIRLVEREAVLRGQGETRILYATLSHVRGAVVPLRLTRESYHSMQEGITVENLPCRFKDAVKFCRYLSMPYLWIDALCIIQDCEDDKSAQTSQIEKIYRNGMFDIAAHLGIDATHSLFTSRSLFAAEPLLLEYQYADQNVMFFLAPDWVCYTRATESRAVAIRYLSTRIMHFSQFPFFECNVAVTTEANPRGYTGRDMTFHSAPLSRLEGAAPESEHEPVSP